MVFLWFIFGKDGIGFDPLKVDIITSWPKPDTLTGLRSFLGLFQFYRRFNRDISGVAELLTNLTKMDRGIQKSDSIFEEAFE